MYLSDACTLPVNMAGLPGMSIPAGLSRGPAGRTPADRAGVERARALPPGAGIRGDHRRRGVAGRWSPSGLGALRETAGTVVTRRDAPPARRACPVGARAGRAAVGHPALLRHRGDDGGRDQPRRRGAGLRHAGPGRSRRDRVAPREAHHYTSNYGTLELRTAISDHLARRYGVRLRPGDARCLVTVGASEAVDLALRATIEPRRRGDPPRALVRRVRPVRVLRRRHRSPRRDRFEDDFALDPAAVAAR